MRKLTDLYSLDEIELLTGTKQISKQIQWLTDNNYIFDVSYKGDVVLHRDHVREKLTLNIKGEK